MSSSVQADSVTLITFLCRYAREAKELWERVNFFDGRLAIFRGAVAAVLKFFLNTDCNSLFIVV